MNVTKTRLAITLGIVCAIALILLSQMNGSIFLDKILLSYFIIVVPLLARSRNAVKENIDKNHTNP